MRDPQGVGSRGRPLGLAPLSPPPPPLTRARSAGMPELETAGRGEGGGLSGWGLVERERGTSLFQALAEHRIARVLGAD